MRFYGFGNFYLSQIQQGIQAAHVISEMSRWPSEDYSEWSSYHKTIILLNGGNQKSLEELLLFLNVPENPYQVDSFREDGDSLNYVLTCVGIILPEKIYLYDETKMLEPKFKSLTEWERNLAMKLKEYRLA